MLISLSPQQHVPAHFDHVRRELEAAGYTCVGVDLPGNTAQPRVDGRLVGIDDDVAAVRQAVVDQLDSGSGSGSNVVVVTHSYGSIPGTAALAGLGAEARELEGKSTSVTNVVVIAGFLLPAGTTMLAVMGGQLPPQYLHEGDTTLPFNGPGAIQVLYNDINPLEAQKAIWRLKPQSYGINTSPVPDQAAASKDVPVSYLLCSDDRAVPWVAQTATVAGFRAAGRDVYAEVAPSGHSPFLKVPGATARFVRKVAGEDLVTGFEVFRASGSEGED